MRTLLLTIAAGLALLGCTTPAAPSTENVTITLQRSLCFGFCPDYTVSITGDGHVTYNGRRFVNVTGEQHGTASPEDIRALLARFDAVRFTTLRDEYRANISDLPSFRVTLTRNGQTKSVLDYGGTGAGMPEAVREIENEIDRIAHTDKWVLRNGEHVRQ